MRTTPNLVDVDGKLTNGYDYKRQAWVLNGVYVRCGHPESMNCQCYGRLHQGEQPQDNGR